jgi:hypothetical protein
MPQQVKDNRKYSPANICLWFGIPRTTLFRWEELGLIPKADRDTKGQRSYRRLHIKKISDMVRARLREEVDLATKYNPESPAITQDILERLDMIKFFSSSGSDQERGLEALLGLARQKRFRQETIRALIEEAYQRPPEDSVRQKIWELILFHDQQSTNH